MVSFSLTDANEPAGLRLLSPRGPRPSAQQRLDQTVTRAVLPSPVASVNNRSFPSGRLRTGNAHAPDGGLDWMAVVVRV